jgi:hypothetical protein
VLGIHAPEFGFEKKYRDALQAVKKHKIKVLIAQDNGFHLWQAYKNRYWYPTNKKESVKCISGKGVTKRLNQQFANY